MGLGHALRHLAGLQVELPNAARLRHHLPVDDPRDQRPPAVGREAHPADLQVAGRQVPELPRCGDEEGERVAGLRGEALAVRAERNLLENPVIRVLEALRLAGVDGPEHKAALVERPELGHLTGNLGQETRLPSRYGDAVDAGGPGVGVRVRGHVRFRRSALGGLGRPAADEEQGGSRGIPAEGPLRPGRGQGGARLRVQVVHPEVREVAVALQVGPVHGEGDPRAVGREAGRRQKTVSEQVVERDARVGKLVLVFLHDESIPF